MERNPNEGLGQGAGQSGQTGGSYGNTGDVTGSQGYGAGGAGGAGASEFSGSGSGIAGSSGTGGGYGAQSESGGGYGGQSGQSGAQGLGERAKGSVGSAQEKVQGGLANVRDRAGELKATLADRLQAGAERLRSQSQRGQYAGSAGSAGVGDGAQITDRLATGMQASAEWLRDADIDGLKEGVEGQVKNHPGRTLLIALGLGYLLGKAFRR